MAFFLKCNVESWFQSLVKSNSKNIHLFLLTFFSVNKNCLEFSTATGDSYLVPDFLSILSKLEEAACKQIFASSTVVMCKEEEQPEWVLDSRLPAPSVDTWWRSFKDAFLWKKWLEFKMKEEISSSCLMKGCHANGGEWEGAGRGQWVKKKICNIRPQH